MFGSGEHYPYPVIQHHRIQARPGPLIIMTKAYPVVLCRIRYQTIIGQYRYIAPVAATGTAEVHMTKASYPVVAIIVTTAPVPPLRAIIGA